MTNIGKRFSEMAKGLKDDINKPSYVNTPSYKNKRVEHEMKRGKKQKMAAKMKREARHERNKAKYEKETGRKWDEPF